MTDRGLKALAAALAVALLVVVAVGSIVGSRSVSDDLTDQVEQALATANLADVGVKVTGREVELRPATERDLVRATRVVEQVEGVRWARLAHDIGTADLRPSVAFVDVETGRQGMRISGAVRDAATAAALKAGAAAAFGVTVRGDVAIDPTLPEAEWTELLPGAFSDLSAIKDLSLSVDDGDLLRMSGHIESTRGRDRVIALATSGLPDLTVKPDITVDPGPLPPDDATLLNTFTLFYTRDGVSLLPKGRDMLDEVVEALDRTPSVELEVVGHTGPDGQVGRTNARERVTDVISYLVERGISGSRLRGTTYLSSHRDGDDERFRRVDLVIKGD